MPSFHNNGADVHYEVAGDGSPLLLIAGLASDSASWDPLLPLLTGPPVSVTALTTPMPYAQHLLIAGAAHSIHWEKPAEVARAILDFIDRRPFSD